MFYFGRIISAFFNQLFRFLLWNKFGQKLLIILIISLIAFWCVGMTKVHAVEEVEDLNYKAYNYYDSLTNDFIIRFSRLLNNNDATALDLLDKINNGYNIYLCYGQVNGGSYLNSYPASKTYLTCIVFNGSSFQQNATPTSADYMSITGYTIYQGNIANMVYRFSSSSVSYTNNTSSTIYLPLQLNNYFTANFSYFISAYNSGDTQTIIELLEDIKEEQQAINEFLNEDTDTSEMVIDTPSVTDTASDNMSNNLHNQINTLTTNLQTTVSNYYEGQDAYTWRIPLPSYIGGDIRFDSGVTRKIIGTSGVVYNIIQAIWVVLFGGYIVGFIKRMLDWVQTGKIFDEGGIADFIWWMDTNNEIIKASMM